MAWTLAAPLVRQPHDQGLDRVLDVLLRDPLPGADQRVPGPGPHVRQVDRVDPVCHPARAPHVLPFHSGLAGTRTVIAAWITKHRLRPERLGSSPDGLTSNDRTSRAKRRNCRQFTR
jgi:hypothetical protein